MNNQPQTANGRPKELLAGKAFPLWTAKIDELDDEDGWLLELESAQLYVTLKVAELSVLQRAVSFLNAALALRPSQSPPYRAETDELVLGRFGNAAVSLLRDNEDFGRCFLLVDPGEPCAMRIAIDEESIRALAETLERINSPRATKADESPA